MTTKGLTSDRVMLFLPGHPGSGAATSQDVQFLTDVIRKQDRERLSRTESLPSLTAGNLRVVRLTLTLYDLGFSFSTYLNSLAPYRSCPKRTCCTRRRRCSSSCTASSRSRSGSYWTTSAQCARPSRVGSRRTPAHPPLSDRLSEHRHTNLHTVCRTQAKRRLVVEHNEAPTRRVEL